jgi:hypothetical protein
MAGSAAVITVTFIHPIDVVKVRPSSASDAAVHRRPLTNLSFVDRTGSNGRCPAAGQRDEQSSRRSVCTGSTELMLFWLFAVATILYRLEFKFPPSMASLG